MEIYEPKKKGKNIKRPFAVAAYSKVNLTLRANLLALQDERKGPL